MWNYSEKMMDHFRNPRNVGKIDNPDGEATVGSLAPSCCRVARFCWDDCRVFQRQEKE